MEKGHLRRITLAPPPVSTLEPEAFDFMENLKSQKPIDQMSIEEVRENLEKLQFLKTPPLGLEIEDIEIPAGPGRAVSVQILRPQKQQKDLPAVIYLHGGGWLSGSKETYHRLVSDICMGSGAAVVFVNYSLSPEARFPTALEQSYAVIQYFLEQGEKHLVDSDRLAIAGDNVGANMATVLARWAIERKGYPFLIQILFYPVVDAAMNTESYEIFAADPWLSKAQMNRSWSAYEPSAEKRFHPNLSPLRTDLQLLKPLPQALIITGENDVLRDEGEAYAHRLVDAGVSVTAIRVLGTIPDFLMLNSLSQTEATRNVLDLTCARLKAAFAGSHSS